VLDLYKTKVGFVLFNQQTTPEMLQKTKCLEAAQRTIFSAKSLADPIDKTHSLFVTQVRHNTDLQKLVVFIQKTCTQFQKTCKVTNLKTFYEEQRIKPYVYVELSEAPQ
jgi:molybdenum cofactor biosynthesis enzyme